MHGPVSSQLSFRLVTYLDRVLVSVLGMIEGLRLLGAVANDCLWLASSDSSRLSC
jgi:hypothetical protein